MRRIGKLTLNRNPDNFFAETEQVAFHPGHVVPGHRLHQRSAAAGPALLVHRHAADPPRRPELPRDPDQPPGRARAQQPARRPHAPDDQPRARPATSRTRSAAAARSRPRRRAGGFVSFPEPIEGDEGARAQREVLRPLQPGDAVLQQPVRAGEGAHRRGAALRARQGRAPRHPRAHGRHARAASTRTLAARVAEGLGLAVPAEDRAAR